MPPTVECSPVADETGTSGVGAAVPSVGVVVLATGWGPGDAEAPTRETARKPSPTAAAAEAVQTAPRARVRFMAGSMQPIGLRPPQDGAKTGAGRTGSGRSGVSVAPWPSSW